jgi:hypothetical protein
MGRNEYARTGGMAGRPGASLFRKKKTKKTEITSMFGLYKQRNGRTSTEKKTRQKKKTKQKNGL